ncbi:hypothetical protein FWK35_00010936 [Aphis craccivora]|uniref:Uncharacterized protein n=1 Tax=Aphis craccivora TaxID=307492 RepID=A0A6G0YZG0_APHCR|nr:hypothetical protein FWK35_00010936 [Aphis craccivora]
MTLNLTTKYFLCSILVKFYNGRQRMNKNKSFDVFNIRKILIKCNFLFIKHLCIKQMYPCVLNQKI